MVKSTGCSSHRVRLPFPAPLSVIPVQEIPLLLLASVSTSCSGCTNINGGKTSTNIKKKKKKGRKNERNIGARDGISSGLMRLV